MKYIGKTATGGDKFAVSKASFHNGQYVKVEVGPRQVTAGRVYQVNGSKVTIEDQEGDLETYDTNEAKITPAGGGTQYELYR